MLKKLRIKFIIIVMSVVTIMMSIIFGMVIYFTSRNIQNSSVEMMKKIEDSLLSPVSPFEPQDGIFQPYFVVSVDIFGSAVLTENTFSGLDDEYINDVVAAALNMKQDDSTLKEYSLRYSRVRGFGIEYLIFVDISGERTTLLGLLRTCSIIGFISLIFFFILAYFLAKWAVKPVDEAWQQQKQFVSDASHELKTPLTVILTDAELLQDEDDPLMRSRLVSDINEMSVQMRGLVEGLLELARADNGQVKKNLERINLSALVTSTALIFEPMFFEKDFILNTDIADGISVLGSERHLREVVQILLDNSLKYSKSGETELSLARHGKTAILTQSNPCDEISKEDLKAIFKRFYRRDEARSLNSSYGLGLPIAETIMTEHSGSIHAEYRNGRIYFIATIPTL